MLNKDMILASFSDLASKNFELLASGECLENLNSTPGL
jgi:hypothetical protein